MSHGRKSRLLHDVEVVWPCLDRDRCSLDYRPQGGKSTCGLATDYGTWMPYDNRQDKKKLADLEAKTLELKKAIDACGQ